MRIQDLFEGRDAPLYHWMDGEKAETVFRQDALLPQFAHKQYDRGVSLTRNTRYDHHNGTAVCLVIDQAKLAQTNRIVPLDSEYASMMDTKKKKYRPDRHNWKPGTETAEEYAIGNIKPLHRYLVKILVKDHNDYDFIEPMLAYAKKFGIPVEVLQNPDYFWHSYGDESDA